MNFGLPPARTYGGIPVDEPVKAEMAFCLGRQSYRRWQSNRNYFSDARGAGPWWPSSGLGLESAIHWQADTDRSRTQESADQASTRTSRAKSGGSELHGGGA